MTPEMGTVVAILAGAVLLFVTERLPVDAVALLVLVTLALSGILTPQEAVAGFSNPATITVAAMFVLSAAVSKTRIIPNLAGRLAPMFRARPGLATPIFMVGVAGASAFVNNTPLVALMIPVVLSICRSSGLPPSRLLIPLSFASLFGGVCSLIGTSTNILVAGIAEQHGVHFRMFEIAPQGLIVLAAGTLYMTTVGVRLLPDRGGGELSQDFELDHYLTDLVLLPDSPALGKTLRSATLGQELDLQILEVRRKGRPPAPPESEARLEAGDVLRIRCDVERLQRLQGVQRHLGVALAPERHWSDAELSGDGVVLVEAVVSPASALSGRTLKEAQFQTVYGATVLAIRHRGDLVPEALSAIPLLAGDVLLLRMNRRRLRQLWASPDLLVMSEMEPARVAPRSRRVLLVLAGVVLAAALDLAPIMVTALAGCLVLLLGGAFSLQEAYRQIDWKVLVLLGGILPLGTAMEKTGVALLFAQAVTDSLGSWGPVAVLSAIYLATSLLTEFMSNNASAAVLAPIAVSTAHALGVSPAPFLVAVMFGASASFATPVGYQTNTMVYGAGGYRFADFLRVGAPLNILFWLLATFFIPVFWPL